MIYLYGYLGIGIAVLAVVYGAHRLTKEKESESLRELLDAVNPDRKKLSFRILNNIIAPVLAAILVVAVWPVAVYMKVKEMLQKKESNGFPEEREFAVEREHLLERMTVQEIEMREIVTDPLQAAPELPFGHLHAAWKDFLKGHAEGGELWSFSALWQTTWGRKELRSGYVLVENGSPGAHFLTVWKDLPDDAY
ncbi:hypothetical protein OPEN69S_03353 [Ottowia pentelensis]